MATSAVPAVIDALVEGLRAALPNVLVHDGVGQTEDPGDFLMVGVDNPFSDEGETFSAEASQSWADNGVNLDQEGEVQCVAVSWNGDGDQKAARDAAYAVCGAVEGFVRDESTLGVPSLLWASYSARSERLSQAQGPGGASSMVFFTVHFRARI